MLSAVIITRDEADRIERAVRSVAFADEVVVLDSGSTDDTVARARALGARVEVGDWPGHVAQKNRAMAMCQGPWVLSIDADEWVSEALQRAILQALRAPVADGYRVARRNRWLGRELRGGRWYPDRRVRLVRMERSRWKGTDPHDQLDVDGTVADLEGDLYHEPYRSLAEHLLTVDRYSRIGAEAARAAGRRAGWLDLAVRPPWHFFRAYVLEAGWKDGVAGLVLAALGATHTLLKWARLKGLDG